MVPSLTPVGYNSARMSKGLDNQSKGAPGNGPDLDQWYRSSHFYGSNAPLLEAWYESWLEDESSVSDDWARTFNALRNGGSHEQGHLAVQEKFRQLSLRPGNQSVDTRHTDHKQASVSNLIDAYRVRGHEMAQLDPLKRARWRQVPDLDPSFHNLTDADLDREFDTGSQATPDRLKLRDIVDLYRRVYCKSIGAEYMHIVDSDKRRWVADRLELGGGHIELNAEKKIGLLERLTAAEGIEKYLHSKYVGQKRFSLEGGESLIPLLHDTIRHAGNQGVREAVIGMAHRGRLNVLVNILGKSPAELFSEFEGTISAEDPFRAGDVKYHLGYSSDVKTERGLVHVALAFNPSHLEIVDPVVAGSARARQDRRNDLEHDQVMPILIHGDAAFAGQGVIMELFQMSETRGFAVGGTLHIVINNQIGFTTSNPLDARSTVYCTAIAKMVHAPIFHVNAEDPEAVHHVMKIALDFRKAYKRDVVIDLVCYRRHGHNEADEPAATQPLMYQTIRQLPSTRENYAARLVKEKVLSTAQVQNMADQYRQKLDQGEQVAEVCEKPQKSKYIVNWSPYAGQPWDARVDTTISSKQVTQLSAALTRMPDDFEVHGRVAKIIGARSKMGAGEIPMDWGFAENMAYASLVAEGYGLRLVGQDSARGTFFHRHAIWHNQSDGRTFAPLAGVNPKVEVTIIDSLLSEEAVLGFEYGYACSEPDRLIIWEAQFGDFVNGAQVVIDQFITSGETKWGRLCGLVMFLPHGYEGQGPEHSSARLERFLQMCSAYNVQVCVPTTPAQMFHLLRRQMLRLYRKPLIVMTPKSLLRSKASTSNLSRLSAGGFQLVIDDPYFNPAQETERASVHRLVLCSGKVFYDLAEARDRSEKTEIALLRIEQLYPFPRDRVVEVLALYPNATELVWCQEEPRNQGAWYASKHKIEACKSEQHQLFYAGRRTSASPAVGYYSVHIEQQRRLVNDALSMGKGQADRNTQDMAADA